MATWLIYGPAMMLSMTRGRPQAGARSARSGRRSSRRFRPHSHHWQVMAGLRASPHGAGHIDLGGARMLCFVTGEWGDGFYPVDTDHGTDGRLMQIRIVLGDEERRQRTEAFRERWA